MFVFIYLHNILWFGRAYRASVCFLLYGRKMVVFQQYRSCNCQNQNIMHVIRAIFTYKNERHSRIYMWNVNGPATGSQINLLLFSSFHAVFAISSLWYTRIRENPEKNSNNFEVSTRQELSENHFTITAQTTTFFLPFFLFSIPLSCFVYPILNAFYPWSVAKSS